MPPIAGDTRSLDLNLVDRPEVVVVAVVVALLVVALLVLLVAGTTPGTGAHARSSLLLAKEIKEAAVAVAMCVVFTRTIE